MSQNSFNGDKLSRSHNTSAVVTAIRKKTGPRCGGAVSFLRGRQCYSFWDTFLWPPLSEPIDPPPLKIAPYFFFCPPPNAHFSPLWGEPSADWRAHWRDRLAPPRSAPSSRPIAASAWLDGSTAVQTSSPCLTAVRTSRRRHVALTFARSLTRCNYLHLYIHIRTACNRPSVDQSKESIQPVSQSETCSGIRTHTYLRTNNKQHGSFAKQQ